MISKKSIITALISISMCSGLFLAASAPVSADLELWDRQLGMGDGTLGDSFSQSAPTDIRIIIARIIKVFLSFLGIILLSLLIFAGYKWMTAGGNEKQVSEATALIKNSIIGLLIVVSAYAITIFVLSSMNKAVGDIYL
jgi:hypothetical protein